MGSLRELSNKSKNIHLLMANSGIVELYVYDKLKVCHGCNADSAYKIETKSQFNEMLSLVNVQPYTALSWLFQIEYNKNTKSLMEKYKGIFSSEGSCFMIKVKRYADFKAIKELVPQCNDLYLSLIRKRDVAYLFNGLEIAPKLLDFVSGSYCKEPEKVFELREQILKGVEVKTQKDVVNLIGVSSGSVNSLAFLLLADPPKSKSGLSRVLKKRMQLLSGLSEVYGVSKLRNFLRAVSKDLLDLKTLYMQGIIFNRIKDLPDSYDEERLSKYEYCLERVCTEIPYMRLLKLNKLLETPWRGDEDYMNFLYTFYSDVETEGVV